MANSYFDPERNTWTVNGTIVFRAIHPKRACKGQNCIVHNPRDNPANRGDWPFGFRDGHADGRIERYCQHGVGHPDVDQVAYLEEYHGGTHWGIHACCGCC